VRLPTGRQHQLHAPKEIHLLPFHQAIIFGGNFGGNIFDGAFKTLIYKAVERQFD